MIHVLILSPPQRWTAGGCNREWAKGVEQVKGSEWDGRIASTCHGLVNLYVYTRLKLVGFMHATGSTASCDSRRHLPSCCALVIRHVKLLNQVHGVAAVEHHHLQKMVEGFNQMSKLSRQQCKSMMHNSNTQIPNVAFAPHNSSLHPLVVPLTSPSTPPCIH